MRCGPRRAVDVRLRPSLRPSVPGSVDPSVPPFVRRPLPAPVALPLLSPSRFRRPPAPVALPPPSPALPHPSQRNLFLNLTLAAGQAAGEMRGKLKVLLREVDILKGEGADLDQVLQKQRHDGQVAQARRDAACGARNRALEERAERRERVDARLREADKLGAAAAAAERDLLAAKARHERALEARNHAGLVLVDRTDELCVLHERGHAQEAAARRGEAALADKEDEARRLRAALRDAQRSLENARARQPQQPALDAEIAGLQAELAEAERETDRLSRALEDPAHDERWRRLDRAVPDREAIAAEITRLKDRLARRGDQLAEREAAAAEADARLATLRRTVADGADGAALVADAAREARATAARAARRAMAGVAELSVAQASALKLEAERVGLAAELETARDALSRGEPPDEGAVRELWRRVRLDEMAAAAAADRRAAEAAALDDGSGARGAGTTRTAAPARPQGYLPRGRVVGADGDGGGGDDGGGGALAGGARPGEAVPYGGRGAMAPTKGGAAGRHWRKPEPRAVVL